ncbi:hypothetical protein Tco_0556375 [Tanacetum coccineum]
MEAHCIALELKYQNQALKSGQHGQILNETSNKAKIEKEIDVLETMNIKLEHSVAKLRKENETLKKHYKDFSDSRKGFCNCCIEKYLRKLKGSSVDTKFDKTLVLGKLVLQSPRNQSVVRQPNAFKSERPQMSKQWFASQVDVNNNFSKPFTQHYLPKKTESAFAKPDHMIASSSSRNSSKNIPRFSSNDMVHNHYLDEARKKTQERDRNSKSSVMPTARFQSTTNDSKPKPRNNNQTPKSFPVSKSSYVTITAVPNADHSKSSSSFSDSKNFVCSTCHKCVFNANHDACITKLLKEVNSRAKIQSHKTRNSNKPKTSPRSDLRWKTTGRIFKSVGLRWIPIGNYSTLAQASTSINVQKEQSLDLSAELESLFGHLFDEYLNGENQVVSKSSAVTTTDASDKRQQQLDLTSSTSTLATTVTADGNFDLVLSYAFILETEPEHPSELNAQSVDGNPAFEPTSNKPLGRGELRILYESNLVSTGKKRMVVILYVRIHPNTKPIIASVFRDNDKRNFDVHQPFKFSDFRIIELDELGPIIQNTKNSVIKDLMTSLSKRYERLKKIHEELRIQYPLPTPVPEQASSQTSGRKRKHMELEPKVKVHGLECNRSLPEGVGVDSLVSYLVMDSMVKTEENARFSLKLRKMIADHPDQDKLKSKEVKLEALGYHVE